MPAFVSSESLASSLLTAQPVAATASKPQAHIVFTARRLPDTVAAVKENCTGSTAAQPAGPENDHSDTKLLMKCLSNGWHTRCSLTVWSEEMMRVTVLAAAVMMAGTAA